MSRLIDDAVNKFIKDNNCEHLKDEIIKLLNCDEVTDAIMVKQSKMMFNWKFKSEMSAINNERELAGLKPLKPRPFDLDLIEDEFQYIQQTSNNWQKYMRKAINKVMGGLKQNDNKYDRIL